jgi:Cdc6-like AAA superfamily ATPase
MTDTTVLEITLLASLFGIMVLYYIQSKQIAQKKEEPTPNSSTANETFLPIILPDRKIALVKNFHQTFNEKHGVNLGWRQWWIDNKTKSNIPEDNTTILHLDTMDNLVNSAEINRIINNSAWKQ